MRKTRGRGRGWRMRKERDGCVVRTPARQTQRTRKARLTTNHRGHQRRRRRQRRPSATTLLPTSTPRRYATPHTGNSVATNTMTNTDTTASAGPRRMTPTPRALKSFRSSSGDFKPWAPPFSCRRCTSASQAQPASQSVNQSVRLRAGGSGAAIVSHHTRRARATATEEDLRKHRCWR